ncbi:MAG: DNA-directed RNA polymerase subunit omega [Clostridia bacterium]|nr:DNA-directed RNA polymerase subunit omega [Clostridia bacterium]
MIHPPIAQLVEKTGSRYTLVLEAAKRARQLSGGATPLVENASGKDVSVATREIYEEKIQVIPMAGIDVVPAAENMEQED